MSTPTQHNEIQELKKSLIGLLDKMSNILKDAPEDIGKVAQHLTEFQRRVSASIALSTYVSKADKKFLEEMTHTLDEQIQPLMQENRNFKQAQRQHSDFLQKKLQAAKTSLQQNDIPSTPRVGRKG